ncbi:hypothetical protein STCU_10677 [Strigomonas culicis]|uniref:Uncharacterized protein n=1 Tax=Strigomonas culicis TaxID=28005 RepID=S9TKJ1_9TRYP|nr:hypothetical protein STCU_10677 [Strigomonas culicis]|eukprot:EPY17344.1 hypothetical protein STCU_10677 [Strigomonas culicis]
MGVLDGRQGDAHDAGLGRCHGGGRHVVVVVCGPRATHGGGEDGGRRDGGVVGGDAAAVAVRQPVGTRRCLVHLIRRSDRRHSDGRRQVMHAASWAIAPSVLLLLLLPRERRDTPGQLLVQIGVVGNVVMNPVRRGAARLFLGRRIGATVLVALVGKRLNRGAGVYKSVWRLFTLNRAIDGLRMRWRR